MNYREVGRSRRSAFRFARFGSRGKQGGETVESPSGGKAEASKERKSRATRLATSRSERLPTPGFSPGFRMIRVSVEVKKGNESRVVAAQAKSIERALNAVKGIYGTDEVKVVFPVEPESFFVKGGAEIVRRAPEKTEDRNPVLGESPSDAKASRNSESRVSRLTTREASASRLPVFKEAGL